MRSSAAEYFRKLSPLKGGNMYENDSHSGRSGRCHCCPYGYHIDLDFVRYCQALNQGAKNDNPLLVELKRMKKARRRQTKSMEAMLGISAQEEDKTWFKDQSFISHGIAQETKLQSLYEHGSSGPVPPPREKKKLFSPPSPPPRKQSLSHPTLRSPPPPDIINSSSLLLTRRNEAASDALQEAVLDFEETLESSREYPRRKSRLDTHHQPYSTIDLLHHTPPHSSHTLSFSSRSGKPSGATVARSNSLPRHWKLEMCSQSATPPPPSSFLPHLPCSRYEGKTNATFFRHSSPFRKENNLYSASDDTLILHDSTSFSRQPFFNHKEPIGMSQSYTFSNNGYSNQSPLISDAMAALNAAQGYSANRTQDIDTMSVTSAMSGVSTTTLQSIRDQMATGLSRLKDLEEEVKGIPTMQTQMDILKEEKRILLEHLRCIQRGQDPPATPFSMEREYGVDATVEDLEARLETLRRFSVEKERRRKERKRSLSPMRVNLHDFHSYRRARRGSLSEGSDTESVHSYRGREKSRERDDTCLYITELNDHQPSEKLPSKKSSYSLPSTPLVSRKGYKDVAVSCRVLTRDVGVSYVAPRSRSIGILTDKIEELPKDAEKKREIKAKPCLQCFRRNQKTFESRSVGTSSPKQDSGHLSVSSLSNESIGSEELDAKLQEHDFNSKNALLQKLGKKSPIISRLSSPQLFPPALTFDNSTNTEPVRQRDQRLNTALRMDDLFSREQLNELLEDAKSQWEATNKSKFLLREIKKPITSERGMQTMIDTSLSKFKPLMQNAAVMAKPSTRDSGIGYLSIDFVESKPTPRAKVRNVGCGDDLPLGNVFEKPVAKNFKSVGVGDFKLRDTVCSECRRRSLMLHTRSVGCGDGKLSDVLCEKCNNLHVRSVGVGDARITDDTCKKCKLKRTSTSSCQVQPSYRSVAVEVNLPPVIKEPSLASTPEVERRPFGSSGVRVCDKCHEAITSVAKDIVSISGPSATTIISQPSKIPRLVDYQKSEQKSPPKTAAENVPSITVIKSQPLDLPLKEEPTSVDLLSSTSSFSIKSEKQFSKTEEKLLLKTPKSEDISSSSSIVSSSHPSISSPPQVKRVPYNRQETYTKLGSGARGFVNPAFEEHTDSKEGQGKESEKTTTTTTATITTTAITIKKELPEKPKREKLVRTTVEKLKELKEVKESEAVIKGKEERKRSSSSSSSSEEDEDEVSLVGSSVATEETTPSLIASSDTVDKQRKKSQPSRGMRAALKVLNDSIGKPVRSGQQLTNAMNIIQKEWFKVSSQKDADPHAVEEYMDAFEEYSKGLLQRVVNLSDINGNTAMHYAVSHGNFDVVSVLLNSKVCNINHQNKAGYTATMLVALAQIRNDAHESVVRKLFESGDVNIKASQHGQTALMLAVSHGRLDMVRMLIAAGANPNIQDEDGSTALMCAAEHGHLAIVRYLVAQPDTDLYLMDNDGSTALTIAVEAGHKDVGVLLYKQMNLSRGSSPYSSVRGGKRPRTPTMARSSTTPPPRSSAPSSPGRSRKSSGRVSPVHARQSSASLSNLIL